MVACQTGHLSALWHGDPAYRHLRGRLPCAVKPIGPHRASEYALHPPGTAFGLLGVLLEGLSGNRHRLPNQEPSHNRSPAVLRLISNRVLAQCLFGSRCRLRLSATSAPPKGGSALGRRPKTISRRDVSPRPRRRRGSLRSGAQPSSPAPFRREKDRPRWQSRLPDGEERTCS